MVLNEVITLLAWWRTICESAGSTKAFFHATPMHRWSNIEKQGLIPSVASRPKKRPAIYLSNQISMAEHYAAMNFGENDAQGWAILRVEATDLDAALLGPDTDHEMDLNFDNLLARGYNEEQLRSGHFPWWVSLEETGQCVYFGHIPASAITLVAEVAGT